MSDERYEALSLRIDGLVTGLNARMDTMAGRMDALSARMDQRFDRLADQLDAILATLTEQRQWMVAHLADPNAHGQGDQ
jgi:small-conductance mechanosensitive channel